MLKFYFSIEKDDEVVYATVAPTLDILEERIAQFERSQSHD